MRTKIAICALLGTALLAYAAKNDPVVMKINGKDVKLSEFQYLYHKNSAQQIEKESLEKYVDRFVVYKLKVAQAESECLDTLPSFKKELDGYKKDLLKPYLEDTTVINTLAQEAYQRMLKNVEVVNIFLTPGRDAVSAEAQKHRIDSLYQCLKNGENIEDLAYNYSEDRSAKKRRGSLGYIKAGVFPYAFEKVAYETPVGEFSEPFRSSFGWHLLKVTNVRDDKGKVVCAHILKLYPKNADEAAKAEVMNKMNAIYDKVVAGADFNELAKAESEDPGSASKGGMLRAFGSGEMVPEFEKTAFGLADGEISRPFETVYGVHIIKKYSSQPVGSFEEVKKDILTMIERDERATMAKDARMNELKKQYGFEKNKDFDRYVSQMIADAAGNDTVFVNSLKNSGFTAFTLKSKKVPVSEVAKNMQPRNVISAEGEKMMANMAFDEAVEAQISQLYMDELYNTNEYFHNLMNEYRDGMLLFEVSNRTIWEGASKDTEGLEAYYNAHKDEYKWDKPKYKGYVVMAYNDSIMQEAVKFLNENASDDDKYTKLKKEFKAKVNVQKVFSAQGENAVVDYLIFKTGKKPEIKKYKEFYVAEGNVQAQPECAADVKMQVVSDYQAYLEEKWVKELKAKYSVKINQKVLKMVK